MISTNGKVYEQRGIVYVKTTRPVADHLSDDVRVIWHDRRTISPEQQRKAWAILVEICVWAGYHPREKEDVNAHLKQRFLLQQVEEYQRQAFSLSDCSMTRAREYIDFLIEFCLMNDVPTRFSLAEYAEDVQKYVYACLIHKKCAVCGKKADLHHVSAIGAGYNRNEKPQIGNLVLPLCREHHMEYHNIGHSEFMDKYHFEPVCLDERLAKVYGLSRKARRTA
jgi:predicted Fe-S protein YdhL (DUF1289 family)